MTESIQANKFLNKHGITFKATFKGDKCPLWDDDKHIHGDRYIATFRRNKKEDMHLSKTLSLSFWNSKHDSDNGTKPSAYDVLACLTKTDPGTFEDFCGEFGFDTDSRKAYQTWQATRKEWDKVLNFFKAPELEALTEIV